MDNGASERGRNYARAENNSREGRSGAEEKSDEIASETQIGSGIHQGGTSTSFRFDGTAEMGGSTSKYFGIFNGTGAKNIGKFAAPMDATGFTNFGNNLLQYLSEKGSLQRKIIHDIVDIRECNSIDSLLDKCIRKAQTKNIERVIISQHNDGPKPHLHLVHDCPWSGRECKCFLVPVRQRHNAIHNSDEWSPEDWAKLLEYLCKNGHWLRYCKSSEHEWKELKRRVGQSYHELHGGHVDLSDELDSEYPKARPLEIRYNQFFTCNERERHSISAVINSEEGSGNSYSKPPKSRNKRTRATEEDVEIFLKTHITTPPENVQKIKAWKEDPQFRYMLPKDDAFKRGVHAYKNMILGATFEQLRNIYIEAEKNNQIYFKAETYEQYLELYHTPDDSFKICIKLLEYQLEDEADLVTRLTLKQNDDLSDEEFKKQILTQVVCEFIQELYYILERKHPDRKKNTFQIIGPAQSWKSWFTKQIANFYISVGDINSCVKGERFPFQDAVNARVNIMNDKCVHPDSLRTFLGPLGGDEDKVAQKGVSGEELTRIPVIHTNNHDIFSRDSSLVEPFRKRIIHYDFKTVDNHEFEMYGQKICNPLVWPKLVYYAKANGYIKVE